MLLQYGGIRFHVTDCAVDVDFDTELVTRTGHWTALDLDMLALLVVVTLLCPLDP